jgi:hypothetical protein
LILLVLTFFWFSGGHAQQAPAIAIGALDGISGLGLCLEAICHSVLLPSGVRVSGVICYTVVAAGQQE